MDDQAHEAVSEPHNGGEVDLGSLEPVRTRWMPKPEQILLLESIFNNGLVNPPKDETVRIRKLLEKFGPVGDANVFYWFQNRRSRSRRRQRQIQACLNEEEQLQALAGSGGGGGISYENIMAGGFVPNSLSPPMNAGPCAGSSSSSSSRGLDGNNRHNSDGIITFSGQFHDYEQNPIFCSADASSLPYQSEVITVFINGIATEVGRGPMDIKGMFGGDFMVFHSSGIPIQVNEYGFLVHGLEHGESYFLVPRYSGV